MRQVAYLGRRATSERVSDGQEQVRFMETYDNGAFTPTAVPVTRDVADPITLSPYAWADMNFGIELDAHLKIALQDGLGDGEGA